MEQTQISVGGITRDVPSVRVNGKTVMVTGGMLKVAAVKDEDYLEGDVVLSPEDFLESVRQDRSFKADLFTFAQKPTDPTPRFGSIYYEWDSVAAIRTTSFSDWWTNRVSSDLRRDVRKAAKLGVIVKPVEFNDDLVRGIKEIYDEIPMRQGGPFWHYKKSLETVKLANATFPESSEFLGAYFGNELIGFIKIVYVDHLARLMQIISKEGHRDKRPTNALIAKAVEHCEAKGCSHLTYGKYHYSSRASTLTAFKHRNGFDEIRVPKYYIPLTIKGRLALRLRLHHGIKELVPDSLVEFLKRVRSSVYRQSLSARKSPKVSPRLG